MSDSPDIEHPRLLATSVSDRSMACVRVTGGSPLERAGVAGMLTDGGFIVAEWTEGGLSGKDALDLLVCIRATPDDVEGALREFGSIPVIAVIHHPDVWHVAEMIEAGASVVLSDQEPKEVLVPALNAAMNDVLVLSNDLAHAMADAVPTPPPASLTSAELDLLRDLLDEASVEEIAAKHAFSMRTIYRLLAGIYKQIGVKSRIGAVALASRWNLDREQ